MYEREAEAAKWTLVNTEAEHSFNTDLSASLLHENSRGAALNKKMAEELKRRQNAIAITDAANHRIKELIEDFTEQVCCVDVSTQGVHLNSAQYQIGTASLEARQGDGGSRTV